MRMSVTFKDFEPSDHLRKYAERRFAKLSRFMGKSEDAELVAVVSVDKIRHKIDVRVTSTLINVSAMESSADMYASIDMVLDKLTAQLKKYNEKRVDKRRRAGKDAPSFSFETERYTIEQNPQLKRRVLFTKDHDEIECMSPEDAIAEMVEQNAEHLVFLDANTDTLHMVYRKKNGIFCLIEAISEE